MQLLRKLKAPLIQFPAVRRYLVEKQALSDAWIEAMAQRDCLVAERERLLAELATQRAASKAIVLERDAALNELQPQYTR